MHRALVLCVAAFAFALFGGTLSAYQPKYAEPIAELYATGASAESRANEGFARHHQGAVTDIATAPGHEDAFCAGQDGFVSHIQKDGSIEDSWQVSDISVRALAVHPDGNTLALYESDGFSVHRVSVWNWAERKRLYAKRFRDSVISLSWSAKGTYLLVGNTSVDGVAVMDGKSGAALPIFKKSPGFVSLGSTGASESSVVTFGPSGRIAYTDVASGAEKAAYLGPSDVSQPALHANKLKIAGIAQGQIVEIDATSGKTLATYPAKRPVMATSEDDAEPRWIDQDADQTWKIHTGSVVSAGFTVPDSSPIVCAIGTSTVLYAGTDSGMVYRIDLAVGSEIPTVRLVTRDAVARVDSIATDGERLFLLVGGNVLLSTGPGRAPLYAFTARDADRVCAIDGSLVVWSARQGRPITKLSLDGESSAELYRPTEGIRSLCVYGTSIAFVEGSSKAVVIDTATQRVTFSYDGAGLQDVALLASGKILVSKSATPRSPTPLLCIDTVTGETVPVPISADVCFGLRTDATDVGEVSVFLIKSAETTTTELSAIRLDPSQIASTTLRTVAIYGDEDNVAVNALVDGKFLTNLGKSALTAIDAQSGEQRRLDRGHSLPAQIVLMGGYIVTVNYDGSLSWFTRDGFQFIGDSVITANGVWME